MAEGACNCAVPVARAQLASDVSTRNYGQALESFKSYYVAKEHCGKSSHAQNMMRARAQQLARSAGRFGLLAAGIGGGGAAMALLVSGGASSVGGAAQGLGDGMRGVLGGAVAQAEAKQ